MSRAKPAAAELSPGEWVPAVVRPTMAAMTRASTAASARAPICSPREPSRSGRASSWAGAAPGVMTSASAIGSAGATGARRPRLRGLRTLLVLLHERLEPRVAGPGELDLLAPRRRDHRGRQVRVGREVEVGLTLGELGQLVD